MGQLGRKLAAGSARALARDLTRALADEWFAHYNYWLVSQAVRGHWSPDLIRLLRRKSERALARADRLAQRVRELGKEPPAKLGALLDHATDKPFKLPLSLSDAKGLLTAVLDAERTSIRTFEAIRLRASRADALTRRLAEDFLAEAVSEEQELERLIGDAAPGKDGR